MYQSDFITQNYINRNLEHKIEKILSISISFINNIYISILVSYYLNHKVINAWSIMQMEKLDKSYSVVNR